MWRSCTLTAFTQMVRLTTVWGENYDRNFHNSNKNYRSKQKFYDENTKIKTKTPKKNIRNLAIKLHKKKETMMWRKLNNFYFANQQKRLNKRYTSSVCRDSCALCVICTLYIVILCIIIYRHTHTPNDYSQFALYRMHNLWIKWQ